MGQTNSFLRRSQPEPTPPDRQRRFSLSARPLASLRRLRRRSSSSSEQSRSKRLRSELNVDPRETSESNESPAADTVHETLPDFVESHSRPNSNSEEASSPNSRQGSRQSSVSSNDNLFRNTTRSSASSEEVFFDADPVPEPSSQPSATTANPSASVGNTANHQEHSAPRPRNRTFSGLNAEEEQQLISQLSRTLFTAVMVIATHEMTAVPNDAEANQNATPHTGTPNNEPSGTEMTGSDPVQTRTETPNANDQEAAEELLRQAMVARIWRQLLPELNGGSEPRNLNPLRSRPDADQLSQVEGLDGEPFMTFMDNLWDGTLNADISEALSGARQAFFRIFRFPRDEDNRHPVIVLRVSAADPPAGHEDANENEANGNEANENEANESEANGNEANEGEANEVETNENGINDTDTLFGPAEDTWPSPDSTDAFRDHYLRRVLNQFHRSRMLERSQERAQAEQRARAAGRPGNGEGRAWITYVVRSSFHEDHAIFQSPGLRSNNPTPEDLQMLDRLFTPKALQTATQTDIDRAGGEFTVGQHSELKLERCPVCLIDYEEGDECRKLNCTHVFHKECVDGWLIKSHNSCPMCRHEGVPVGQHAS